MTVQNAITAHSYSPGAAMLSESLAPMVFLDAADLVVTDPLNVVQTLGTDYRITGNGRTGNGSIQTLRAYPLGVILTINRKTSNVQLAATPPHQPLPAAALERELDRRALISAEQGARLDRTLSVPIGAAAPPVDLTGLVEGDLLQFKNGQLRRFPREGFAGMYYVGDASGAPVPAAGTGGGDAALRGDLANPAAGAALMAYAPSVIYAPNSVGARLAESGISISDSPFNAKCDGVTDDAAAIQAAVNYSAQFADWKPINVAGPALLGSSIFIDRPVNTYASPLKFRGQGPRAGFKTAGNVTMLDSNLPAPTAPQSEWIEFDGMHFSSSSAFNASWVMSGKFLRIKFTNSWFWLIRLVNSAIYMQNVELFNCNIRNWPGKFIDVKGLYMLTLDGGYAENGFGLIRCQGSAVGINTLNIVKMSIEGHNDLIVDASGVSLANIAFNHIESFRPLDFNFYGAYPNNAINFIGNEYDNFAGGVMAYYSATDRLLSEGNLIRGTSVIAHANAAFINSIEIADSYSGGAVASDVLLNNHFGPITTSGIYSNANIILPYSADIQPVASQSNGVAVVVTDANPFIMRAPLNGVNGQPFKIYIKNTTANPIGAITWVPAYKMAVGGWTNPASGFTRSIPFEYLGGAWVQSGPISPDVPN